MAYNDLMPQTVQRVVATAGQNIQAVTDRNLYLLIDPTGTLATLTVTLPASPQDGDVIRLGTSQILTLLTVTGGTIVGTLTTLVLGGFAQYIYNSASSKWFRVG